MARRLVTALAVAFAVSILAPGVGCAQTFKVEVYAEITTTLGLIQQTSTAGRCGICSSLSPLTA